MLYNPLARAFHNTAAELSIPNAILRLRQHLEVDRSSADRMDSVCSLPAPACRTFTSTAPICTWPNRSEMGSGLLSRHPVTFPPIELPLGLCAVGDAYFFHWPSHSEAPQARLLEYIEASKRSILRHRRGERTYTTILTRKRQNGTQYGPRS